ncbi:GlxA family transcriptional regulator [Nocardia sp. GCM10030253]|uniref:GlxA family transcriptional regulator n=1 Tax=Nocardia sp. GCM10030253 TaxID=3273404 RepID=UPI0036288253
MDVAVLVVDGVGDFGLAAILEAFATANALCGELAAPPDPWRLHTVSIGTTVGSVHGHLVPTIPLAELSVGFGLMIVPAVGVRDADALIELVSGASNSAVLKLISEAHADGAHVAAACTSTFFLAESGVLDGGPATTSWWLGPTFRRRYPRIDLDEGRTLCRQGRVITAGAVLSHLDLALSLIAQRSPALAELTARHMAVGDRRAQIDFVIPEVIARGDSLVAEFERWVRERIAEPFHLTDAARGLGVTERSLQRATRAEIGMPPREFVDQIRLELATQLLRTTSLTVEVIAARVGYQNASTLRGLFRRRRGRSLAEVRATPLSW